jgi:dUTP pyrophosphatase
MKNTITLKLKKIHPNAKIPKAQRLGDVGFDICCVEDVVVPPHDVLGIRTGLVFADLRAEEDKETPGETPSAVFPQVLGRGGLGLKGLFVLGGIVDSNYRGELIVIIGNIRNVPYEFKTGDKCAQLVFQKIIAHSEHNEVVFVETDTVTETERGDKGFGSSGK